MVLLVTCVRPNAARGTSTRSKALKFLTVAALFTRSLFSDTKANNYISIISMARAGCFDNNRLLIISIGIGIVIDENQMGAGVVVVLAPAVLQCFLLIVFLSNSFHVLLGHLLGCWSHSCWGCKQLPLHRQVKNVNCLSHPDGICSIHGEGCA